MKIGPVGGHLRRNLPKCKVSRVCARRHPLPKYRANKKLAPGEGASFVHSLSEVCLRFANRAKREITTQRQETDQANQRKRATGLRQLSRCWRRRRFWRGSRFSSRRRVLRYLGLLFFVCVRIERSLLPLLVRRFDRRGLHFSFGRSGCCWDWCVSVLSDCRGLSLRICEFLAKVIARIEPGAESLGLSGRRFPERELRFSRRLQAVVRQRQDGCDQLGLIGIEYLHDVPV